MTLYLSYKAAPTYYYFKDKNRKYCYKYTDKKLSLVSGEKDVCNRVKSKASEYLELGVELAVGKK